MEAILVFTNPPNPSEDKPGCEFDGYKYIVEGKTSFGSFFLSRLDSLDKAIETAKYLKDGKVWKNPESSIM